MDTAATARPVTLLEREREVEQIRAALSGAARGSGGALVIEAAPGIGKSRLLGETRRLAGTLGLRVLDATSTQLEQGFPYGVARQLFERALLEADEGERKRWLAGAGGLAMEVLTGTPQAPDAGPSGGDPGYAWLHGLYWLASNIASDAPLVLVVDDLQWCDVPSARALAYIARRLDGQPLALVTATRPLDPALMPEAAVLVNDPLWDVMRPQPLTAAAVGDMIGGRLAASPDDRFVRACVDVTDGNPFLLGELLDEAAARGLEPTAGGASQVGAIVPRGVTNAVLLRLARLTPDASMLARALSVLDDGAHVGDAAQLSGLGRAEVESSMAALVSAGVVQAGDTIRFAHPILRTAISGDLSPAERERLHHNAALILRERGAPVAQVAAHVMQTEPAADPHAVALLQQAAQEALALGDADGAAALLARALDEPPAEDERPTILLGLGQALARAGAPEAVAPLSETVEKGEDAGAVAAAAIELSGMLFFGGRSGEGAAVLRRAQARMPAGEPAREQLDVALLGLSSTSASARREAAATIAALQDRGGPAHDTLQATTLATLAMEEMVKPGSAAVVIDLAERAVAAGLPLEPHRGENWALLALGVLGAADGLDAALQGTDDILVRARARGAALTVLTVSALRALIEVRRGDLAAAEVDAQTAIELAPDLLGARFLVLAVAAAVLAGLERDRSPEALRRLIERVGVGYNADFTSSSQLRYASGVLRAAAGNHEAAIEELRACGDDDPAFGGANPALLAWRSAAARSLAELGSHDAARRLADDEVERAQSFGAARAIGIALRARALVGPASERATRLERALAVLEPSPARLEHARVLVDLGATFRAAGKRTAAREPLLEGLALAARCGARSLERRAKTELAAIGIRPRTTDRTGVDSLTPSERRVVELAAEGGTNREIAQALFVTEKTVETHLGRAFRKLNASSRRQLPDLLARGGG